MGHRDDIRGHHAAGERRRLQVVVVCALGLWLPFAALTILAFLAAMSSPELGQGDLSGIGAQ